MRNTIVTSKRSGYFWLERTSESTVEETVIKVEQHFGLAGMPEIHN